jgi:hypothetical protein
VTGEWRRVNNVELQYLYSSPHIIRVLKSMSDWRNMLHVWETEEYHTGFWWENPRERYHLEYLRVEGRMKKINGPSINRMGEGVKFNWSQDSWMQRAVVNTVMNIRVPFKAEICLSCSRRFWLNKRDSDPCSQ